ncbi:HEAT repeat-containing protein 3-like isoform X1 [Sinocyclocheilus rhinocerous]|uniref:HEAT repeat-containing protein 3-like isoform X1 n=1 Tax=Sinocyclocheilus rhinocerous TaxID=307959 RepID=UPI0007B987E8|nr:PREDICTED: HEAT repeat-containing protein 3-like isoform X1 [Sinocyclocheilus rhinocerous]
MGKTKNNKFKRPSFSPDGLPATPVKQTGDESEDEDSPAAELLDKLQSPSADVREYACASISRVVQQSQTIPGFLQRDAVRKIGPLLLDRSLAVRETAAGALRNLSACGGPEVCEDMVRQDALTPLSALLRECCTGFDMSSSPTMKGQKRTVEDVANEAVNLLWNLCESSSTAVSVFNKAGLLDVLLHCLQRHPQNMELAISAAHCMHTVTEENEELVRNVNAAVFGVLENILSSTHTSMEYTLLRTLAAGSLWNLKSGLSSAQQSQTLTALTTTLSHSLSLDAGELIPELWHAESARLSKETTSATESDHTDARPAGHEAEEMEEDVRDEKMNGRKPNERMSKPKNDISDLLPRDRLELREAKALLSAQQTSLEIIVNMCCSDEPSDDEWEEMSSSDESEVCADGMSDTNSSLFSPLCLSAELHTILLNHSIPQQILKKAEFPSAAALELCSKYPTWKCLLKKMHRVQCRALTCLHNILSSMDTESLDGASGLQAVAQHLSSLVFSSAEALKDEEFLEAVTSALRSLLQIMATKNIPQCMTPHQLMIFCEAATSCELVSVRVNALAILGITGSSLSKEKNTADTLQLIGSALLNIAVKDSNLVVCGEALDALFDVFADGDEAEKAGKNMNLLSSLKALQPGFRAKLRKEGRGKYSPDQLCVLDNIRINLKRFISYLENLQRK